MNLEEKKKVVSWYDNPNMITTLIILVLCLILIGSQSMGSGSQLDGWELFRNVINLNTTYVLVLIYFALLKFKVGKRNFNILNLILILLYFITTITSFLSIFQSFNITSLLSLLINVIIFIQIFHTFFRDTRIWKEFGLEKSPFNEIHNDSYFYIVTILSILYLAINLIFTDDFDGVVITLFVCIYYMLFSRFTMLYSFYLDENGKDSNNSGNFNSIKEKVSEKVNSEVVEEKIEDISKQLEDLQNKVMEYTGNVDVKKIKEANEKVEKKEVKSKPRKKTTKKDGDK